MLSDDVAAALAEVAVAGPANGLIEIAGPEAMGLDDLVRHFLAASGDTREVVTDPGARYFGVELAERSLIPGAHPRLAATRFADWLGRSRPQA
jgi:uncharacterized protein YbjT (DUF2867 family)